MLPSWVWTLGLALLIQGAIGVAFLTRMRSELTAAKEYQKEFKDDLEKVIDKITDRLDVLAGVPGRVITIEAQMVTMLELRDSFNTFKGAQEVHNINTKETLESIKRGQAEGARTLGNIVGELRRFKIGD